MTEAFPSPHAVPMAWNSENGGIPRLGFLGVGWIGRNRMLALSRSGVGEIAAIADPVLNSPRDLTEIAPRAEVMRDLDALLELHLDGIVIATPSALHAEQAIAAFESGCAVFCQKPLARTAAETQQVIDAARSANRLLGVDFSYRHTAGMQAIRRLIQKGELGQIYALEMEFHNAYGPDKPWFYDAKLSGGGCLIDLGIHLVDLALWCLDFPPVEKISGHLLAGGAPVNSRGQQVVSQTEDYAAAQIVLATGAVVQLACSWKAPAGCEAQISATFYGTRGGASFHNVNGSFYDFGAEHFLPDRSRRTLALPPDDWSGRAIVSWARQLARSKTFHPEIESAHRVAAVLDAIYQNAL